MSSFVPLALRLAAGALSKAEFANAARDLYALSIRVIHHGLRSEPVNRFVEGRSASYLEREGTSEKG